MVGEYTSEQFSSLALMRMVHGMAVSVVPIHLKELTPECLFDAAKGLQIGAGKLPRVLVGSRGYDALNTERFLSCLDPAPSQELLATGKVASMFGMGIYSDTLFHPQDRVMPGSDVYVFSADREGHVGYVVSVLRIQPKE